MGVTPLEGIAVIDWFAVNTQLAINQGLASNIRLAMKNVLSARTLSSCLLLGLAVVAHCNTRLKAQEASRAPQDKDAIIVVVGAPGAEEYAKEFSTWADQWTALGERQGWKTTLVAEVQGAVQAKQQFKQAIEQHAGHRRLWLVLVGHGTFARNVAKFNLAGPDVTSKELATWLEPVADLVVVNCFSSSAPFLVDLKGRDRVVVTATRSGSELNYSRFGKYLSETIHDLEVDIDHDKEVSLLEAFLAASSRTQRFYVEDARLATEHALIDDNGDRVGTSSDFYRGIRPVKSGKDGTPIDGGRAARIILYSDPVKPAFPEALDRQRRNLETELELLRNRKPLLDEDDYLDQLETLMLQLAELYTQAENQARTVEKQ